LSTKDCSVQGVFLSVTWCFGVLFGIEQLVCHCSESPSEQQVMQPFLEQDCS